jgi:hypothetical protein
MGGKLLKVGDLVAREGVNPRRQPFQCYVMAVF